MKDDFIPALGRILVYEGGKVNDPLDPGGKTNEGITLATYTAWRANKGLPFNDVFKISHDEVATIYQTEYWNRVSGDKLPIGIDLVMFDAAVNSGVGMAVKWAQAALDLDLRIDGILGSKSLDAILSVNDVDSFIEDYCARRLASVQHLKTYAKFGKGWHARISNVQKIAVEWSDAGHSAGIGTQVAEVRPLGGHVKAQVSDIPVNRGSAVIAHVSAAAGAASTIATQTATDLAPALPHLDWLKYVLGGLTVVSAFAGVALTFSANLKQTAKDAGKAAPVDPSADEGLIHTTIIETLVPGNEALTPAKAVEALRAQLR